MRRYYLGSQMGKLFSGDTDAIVIKVYVPTVGIMGPIQMFILIRYRSKHD